MVGHDKDGKNMVIFSLAVIPEFQRNGISKQLMLRFIEVSKGLKKEKILLLCKSELIPYYQNYGFLYGGKSKSKHGGFEWYEMYLPLNDKVACIHIHRRKITFLNNIGQASLSVRQADSLTSIGS